MAGVWVDVPEDADLEIVKAAFAAVFGHRWEDVVVGRDREALFRFWEGYVGVKELEPHPKITVAQIRTQNPGVPVYEVLLG